MRRKILCGGCYCGVAVWKWSWCDAAAALSAQLSVPRPLRFLWQMCTKSVVFDLKSPGMGSVRPQGGRSTALDGKLFLAARPFSC